MPSVDVPESFAATWGCQMIAYILTTLLYGMALLLIGQYFWSHSVHDGKTIKAAVATLGVLATLQFCFLSHQIYEDYVSRFGDKADLDIIIFSAPIQLLMIFLAAFVAQIFFASRIWIVTQHGIYYTAPIVVLALLQISAGIVQTILVFKVHRYSNLSSTAVVSCTQSGATTACDIVITATLCYILNDARSGVKKTDSTINQMIVYAINRGAATSICALCTLVFFVGKPDTFIFMIFLEPSCQLYVISVVSMLASRSNLRAQLNGENGRMHNSIALGRQSLSGPNYDIEPQNTSWSDFPVITIPTCLSHSQHPATVDSPDRSVLQINASIK